MLRLSIYLGYYLINILIGVDLVVMYFTFPLAALCFFEVASIKEDSFTFRDMFWFLIYLFFVIAPLQRIEGGALTDGPVDGYIVTNSDLITACAIPLIFSLVISVCSRVFALRRPSQVQFTLPARMMPGLTILMILFFAVYVGMSGVQNLFLSRFEKVEAEMSGSTIFYAAQIVTATLSATIIQMARDIYSRGKYLYYLQFSIILACLALTSNPINSPRYFVIAAWVPMFFTLLGGKVGAMRLYAGIAFGLIVVMPVMSMTSRFGLEGLADLEGLGHNAFRIPFIDVFDLLCYEIGFIDQNGFYWGEKTLGILLFFVPRAIWTTKPTLLALDIGDLLVSLKMAGTDNLSMFLGGDFYADGGLAGVLLGSVLLSVVLFGFAFRKASLVNGIPVPGLILMAALPILLRGPLAANLFLTVCQYVFLFGFLTLFGRRGASSGPAPAGRFAVGTPLVARNRFRSNLKRNKAGRSV